MRNKRPDLVSDVQLIDTMQLIRRMPAWLFAVRKSEFARLSVPPTFIRLVDEFPIRQLSRLRRGKARFDPACHFRTDSKEVFIRRISARFAESMLSQKEYCRLPAMGGVFQIVKRALDWHIKNELPAGYRCHLSIVWDLLLLQPNGESGLLTTRPKQKNVFYITDVSGFEPVEVRWNGGWDISSRPCVAGSDLGKWLEKGDRVIGSYLML